MEKALNDIDSLVRRIVNNIDEDAVLLITSDHGKSDNGSHIDCKDKNEIVCNSIFFAYSKKGFI